MNKEKFFHILDSVKYSLTFNKLRSFLTMLGVIIGVFSVVMMFSLGRGIQNFVVDRFNSLGSNILFIAPGKVDFADDPAKFFTKNKLSEKHVDLIKTYAGDYIIGVVPSIRFSATATNRTNAISARVIGTDTDALKIFNFEVSEGRFFDPSNVKGKQRVALIGVTVKEELFGTENPIDKTFRLGDDSYRVIGVLKEAGRSYDGAIIIPYTSAVTSFNINNFSSIAIKSRNNDMIPLTIRQVELALLRDLDRSDFSVLNQQDILNSIQNILRILTIGIGAIAGISLVVGGIGIMNIMLVSVTERTKEIGLRKALGATPFDIAIQFMLESVVLSSVGGFIGLSLAYGLSFAMQSFFNAEVPYYAVVIAFSFSLIVGVVFGTYPAISAAKKDPIEALRHE